MFRERWLELGGDPNPKGKPKVKELLILRGQSKSVSFGLFYGKTAIGLGDTLNIPAVTDDLMTWYPKETEIFILNNDRQYKEFLEANHKGRESASAYKAFLKREHREKRYMGNIKTADDLIDLFYATFPNIHAYLLGRAEFAVVNKYVRTSGPVGRIRRFKFPESSTEENSIRRKAQNSPIQG
jgi:DNA polymerase I-like protein with 3'-5' exonuclease and polymerase domains